MRNFKVEKTATLRGHKDSIYALCSSQYSHIIFSSGADGMVVSWDLKDPENGRLIAKVPNSVYALTYDVESDLLIVGHNYDGIHLVRWQDKKEVGTLNFTDQAIFTIKIIGSHIVAGTANGELVVIDRDKLIVKDRIKLSDKSLRCLAISEKTNEIAAGYSDDMIRIFDMQDFSLKREWTAHEKSVFSVCYSMDSKLMLSAGRDAKFKDWSPSNDYQLKDQVIAHTYAINDIAFSPEGKHFVTCSMDKMLKIWEVASLKLLKVIDKARHAGHSNSVNKVLWTSFNNQIVSCSDDRTISVWNLQF